jgi:Na+/H+ antiporter NhaD/arsenite permease-like protein
MRVRHWLMAAVGLSATPTAAEAAGGAPLNLPPWTVAPFVLLLLAIAFLPLAAPRWWHHNRNRALVSAVFAVPVAGYLLYLALLQGQPTLEPLGHELKNYVAFIILLGSLYTVSGGIVITGDIEGRPLTNTGFLALGAVLANLIGTTGASVLLIRPLLRINKKRRRTAHLPVFFIFMVSNLGGLLTSLGDPPLFLGFLHGVPFFWTLGLWPQWLLTNGLVLLIFYVWDCLAYRREAPEDIAADIQQIEPLHVKGWRNVFLLGGVVAGVLTQGIVPGLAGEALGAALMLLAAGLSLWLTPAGLRKMNAFSWGPIAEVAILFAGIFVTMVPALDLLAARGRQFGVTDPCEYFWLTGLLSGFLDNAPTYLTFATMAAGSSEFEQLVANQVPGLNGPLILQAISCGAVFMGALTYIGNGPNFMVKAIADEAGFKTPSFFGYVSYSVLILLPTFAVVTVLFFRP